MTVRTNTESWIAVTACRSGGTVTYSPFFPSYAPDLVLRRTWPCSTCRVASPGLYGTSQGE